MSRADRKTNALYRRMRARFGVSSAMSNGYRYEAYFRREQALLHALLDPQARVVLDACCGSGLMLAPLVDGERLVFGLDFNRDACAAAADNGFPVVCGDAYQLPLGDGSVDEIINCQFFNQQQGDGMRSFIGEAGRVLRPGGRLIVVWRNADAVIHRVAHALLSGLDTLRGLPRFPQYRHTIAQVSAAASASGFTIEQRAVSCPPLNWRSDNTDGLCAMIIGASNIAVLRKPR